MISNDRRIQILVELRELTERQLSAARELNGTAMRELNELRSDHLFNLQVAMQAPMPNDQELKQALIDEVKRLQAVEERLTRITELVLQTFEQMTPYSAATTYGASGRLSG